MVTRDALKPHTQRLKDLTWTRAQKTSDSTRTYVLRLVNNHYVFFFRRTNVEETLKHPTSLM